MADFANLYSVEGNPYCFGFRSLAHAHATTIAGLASGSGSCRVFVVAVGFRIRLVEVRLVLTDIIRVPSAAILTYAARIGPGAISCDW